MLKKRMLCLVLVLCALCLCSCQEKEVFSTTLPNYQTQTETANQVQPAAQNLYANTDVINFDDGTYDPSSEEGGDDWEDTADNFTVNVATPVPTMNSEYAGATPVIIDPIDKPTPTPLPEISFSYTSYEAAKLHLTFEAPVGWIADDSQTDLFILTNPDLSMDFAASMIIGVQAVTSQYNEKALTSEIKNMLNEIKASGVKNFDPSNTANATMLGASGVYANYTASLSDGTQIAGRVIACCVDKKLYTLHISYPRGYRDSYAHGPYAQFRKTVKITQ